MRDDPTELYVAGLKINEDVAILAAILGLLLILVSRRRQRLVNDPASDNLDIAEDTTPAQLPASRT
jgi:hypothetical protein